MHFDNQATVDGRDWVVNCDWCDKRCKASETSFGPRGLLLCNELCIHKYVLNPIETTPIPSITDQLSPPFVRPETKEIVASVDPWDPSTTNNFLPGIQIKEDV